MADSLHALRSQLAEVRRLAAAVRALRVEGDWFGLNGPEWAQVESLLAALEETPNRAE